MPNIKYPYIPEGREIEYVSAMHPAMQAAKEFARLHSLDKGQPTGSALEKNGVVIGLGANGSDYHLKHGCERVRQGIPTGQRYELCEGCHPKNHSEPRAIGAARTSGRDPAGSNLYLWGHWWCCEPCWSAINEAGINHVYLVEGSEILFDRAKPGNIVGERQFD
jgi:deoxycytidylate deaminase